MSVTGTKEIQRQIGRKRYQPVWEMVHKLRDVMGKRDGGYPLHGDTEIDEGFFSTETPEEQKDCPLKRGRVTTDGFSSYASLEKDGMASTSCCCSVMHLSTPTKRSFSKLSDTS